MTRPRDKEDRRSDHRVLAAAFVLSALIHMGALAWPLRTQHSTAVGDPAEVFTPVAPSRAMQAYRIVVTEPQVPVRTERPREPEAEPAPPDYLDEPPPVVEVASPRPAAPASRAARFRPRSTDPRLWPRASPAITTADRAIEAERLVLATRIRALDASTNAERGELRGMTTWTTSGADGRWGFSPGRVYLGGVTLPTCGGADAAGCGFGLVPNRVGEYVRWSQVYGEIQQQTHRARLDSTWADRAGTIRARLDAARRDTIRRR